MVVLDAEIRTSEQHFALRRAAAMALCLLEHYRQAMIVNARPGARQRQRRLSAVAPVVAAMEELPSSDGQATRGVSSLRSEAP